LAIPQIERPVGPQRVAEQAAVGIDGQYPGELRVFLAHGGKEGEQAALSDVSRSRARARP
jgi:hypothetical protein